MSYSWDLVSTAFLGGHGVLDSLGMPYGLTATGRTWAEIGFGVPLGSHTLCMLPWHLFPLLTRTSSTVGPSSETAAMPVLARNGRFEILAENRDSFASATSFHRPPESIYSSAKEGPRSAEWEAV